MRQNTISVRAYLIELMMASPFQPATNLWRAFELVALKDLACGPLAQAKTIVDLGCGDGTIMRLLRKEIHAEQHMIGVDLDLSEVQLAKETGLYETVHCSGADKLPLSDGAADAVFSNSVLEHIIPIKESLAESARVLKPNGLFVATVPGPGFHSCLRGPWFGGSKQAYCADIDRRLAHERYWSSSEWREHLAMVGISMTQMIPYLSVKQVRRWEMISNLTGGMLSKLFGMKPMAVQKTLGLRKKVLKLPRCVAAALAFVMLMGLEEEGGASAEGSSGCLLILGRKGEG